MIPTTRMGMFINYGRNYWKNLEPTIKVLHGTTAAGTLFGAARAGEGNRVNGAATGCFMGVANPGTRT